MFAAGRGRRDGLIGRHNERRLVDGLHSYSSKSPRCPPSLIEKLPSSSVLLRVLFVASLVLPFASANIPIVTPTANSSLYADNLNQLPGVVVFVAPKTALISHEIANRVVSELRQQNEVEFPIRLRKVRCDFAEAVKAVYEMSSLEFRTSFLLTDLCPDVNFRLSQVLKYRDIALITASDNNPAFRDRQLYANTFSIVPSTESLSRATLNFLHMNDWKKMLLVYDAHTPASSYYSLISSALLRHMEQNGIEVGRPIENKVFDNTMTHIQKSGFKIVFLLMPAEEIAEFLCQYLAETPESSVARHAWLLHTDVTELPIEIMLEETCPGVDKLKLLTAFAIRFAPYDLVSNDSSSLPVPGRIMCSDRARNRPRGVVQQQPAAVAEMATHAPSSRVVNASHLAISHYYRCYYYDGLKAIFRALRNSLAFGGQNPHDAATITSSFKHLALGGKTGEIRFNRATCERQGQVEVVQLANNRPRWIVVFDLSSPSGTVRHYRPVRWPRGRPPLDSVIRRDELETVPVELLASFSAAALLGIAASIGVLVTNIRFRKHSYIKMSSPNLNNFILIGSCLCYTNVVFQGLGTNLLASTRLFEAICTIGTWSLPIGFSLAFGAMLTKTWRVHTIFRHTTGFKRQVIPDSKLITVVFSFVLLDILLNTMWVVFDAQIREVTVTTTTLADAYETTSYIESCSSSFSLWWTLALWLPKGALLIYGLVLAWKTRGVRLAALNDSYQIGVSIYIIVVLCTLGAVTQPLFKTKVVISYCVLSSTLLLSTFVPEVVIFVPKLLKLWKDPIGDQRLLREEMKRATKSTDRVANELARRYISSEVRTRRIRLGEVSDELYKLEDQLAQLGDSNENAKTADIPFSLAVVAIGASLMSTTSNPLSQTLSHGHGQEHEQDKHRLMVMASPGMISVSDERDVTAGHTSLSLSRSPESAMVPSSSANREIISAEMSTLAIDLSSQKDDKTIVALAETLRVEVIDEGSDAHFTLFDRANASTSYGVQESIQETIAESSNANQTEIIVTNENESQILCGDEDVSIVVKKQTPQKIMKKIYSGTSDLRSRRVAGRHVRLSSSGGDLVSFTDEPITIIAPPMRNYLKPYDTTPHALPLLIVAGLHASGSPQTLHSHVAYQSSQPPQPSPALNVTPVRVQRSRSSCVNIYCDSETFL